jgi:hypothetical protein
LAASQALQFQGSFSPYRNQQVSNEPFHCTNWLWVDIIAALMVSKVTSITEDDVVVFISDIATSTVVLRIHMSAGMFLSLQEH